MNTQEVQKLCHELRLFGFHQSIEKRAQEAISHNLHPLEVFKLLLEDEVIFRKNKTAKMLISKAKFRSEASLEEWDETSDRGLSKLKLKELQSLIFYQSHENLILNGPTGTGKTHLAIALGRRLCLEGIRSQFYSVNLLLEEVSAQRIAGQYLPFLQRLSKTPVLILDDLGLRAYSHEEATILVDLIEDRYRKGSIIITSQVNPTGWTKLFDDPLIAEALVNRLVHPSQIVTLKGNSYREKIKKEL